MYSLIAHRIAVAIAGAAVLTTGACTGTSAVTVTQPAVTAGTARCGSSDGPVAASFVSDSTGWLLSITSPDSSSGSRIVLCDTTDGGRRWSAVPAPPAPWIYQGTTSAPDSVSAIVFADQRDGWAFGPGLWATHDGGAHWHRVGTGGAGVSGLAAADGRVVAVFSRNGGMASGAGTSPFAVYTSPAGADAWRQVPGASGAGETGVAIAGHTGYVVSSVRLTSAVTLLTGPANGPGRWQRHAVPCPHGWLADVAAGTSPGVVVTCASIGFHPTPTRVYRSTDGGASWQRLAGLVLEDSISSVSVAPDGTILVSGLYSGALISRDGGKSWHTMAAVDDTDAVKGGGVIAAAMATDRLGFAIVTGQAFWLTHDGGRTWTAVTIIRH